MKDLLRVNFVNKFEKEPDVFLACGGRFEILGNHTDHNHGMCLASACNLKISSAVKKRDDLLVKVFSEGHDPFTIDLSELDVKEEEKSSSPGLIRGVAYYLNNLGYKIGGFEAYMTSTVFPGAGVSSSAAFELLVGSIFNNLFNDGKIERMVLCKAGQYSENNYFGKASGLLDQIGVGFGGVVFIDFKDIKNPVVIPMHIDFSGYHFVLVNTGGSHAELSDLYSAIPNDMYSAAHKLGVNFLRESSLDELEKLNKEGKLSEIEYTRSYHFYTETDRVRIAKEALDRKDIDELIRQIDGCNKSTRKYLKNLMVGDDYIGSPAEALDLADKVMGQDGACKINGGGFAGSIICLVKDNKFQDLLDAMKKRYGDDNVHEIFVNDEGPEIL